jgi:phospholipid/cholesterol/gamma-HCH transport system ATP-binding protein
MTAASKQPKIAVAGLHKSFGAKKVLRGVDLSVGTGESVVVIGGSGSGKSVLIKCILGLLHPDSGSILVDGEETVGLTGRDREKMRRPFGMLFQGSALFDSLPVWENVAFGLIQGERMPRRQAKEIALDKLAAVGLEPPVGEL